MPLVLIVFYCYGRFGNSKILSICIFLLGSIFAGLAQSMTQLILSRVLQGIGAGGNFALVYIVLADVSSPENRGKALSLASFIWGLASVLGPTFGGFVVTYFSWRWIFLKSEALVSATVRPFWPVLRFSLCLPTALYLFRAPWENRPCKWGLRCCL